MTPAAHIGTWIPGSRRKEELSVLTSNRVFGKSWSAIGRVILVVVPVVMAILSPIMAALGQTTLYNSTAGGLKDDGKGAE